MKKFLKSLYLLTTVCVLMIITTGCIKFDTNITIDKKGNAEVVDTILFNRELQNLVGGKVSTRIKQINSQNNPNLSAEEINDGEYNGAKIIYKVQDVSKNDIKNSDLNALEYFSTNHESGKFIEVKKGLFSTTYDIDSIVDYSYDPISNKRDTSWLSALSSQLTINIPVKAKNHNATSVDEKQHTYTWKYDSSDPANPIILTYSVPNILNILLLAGLLIIVGGIITVVLLKKNKN